MDGMEGQEVRMRLAVVEGELGVARLEADAPVPAWAWQGALSSVTRTGQELSVVCGLDAIPSDVQAERGFRCLRVEGPLDFSLTGVLASIAGPLAEAQVSLFAVSTYDTDYILVAGRSLGRAIDCLRAAGHEVSGGI
jgi:hypothetical protein